MNVEFGTRLYWTMQIVAVAMMAASACRDRFSSWGDTAPVDADGAPSLLTALEEYLGVRLETRGLTVAVLLSFAKLRDNALSRGTPGGSPAAGRKAWPHKRSQNWL